MDIAVFSQGLKTFNGLFLVPRIRNMPQTFIRPLTANDFNLIFDWENREEFWGISDESGPFSIEQIRIFMHRCLLVDNGEIKRWIIEDETGMALGIIDVFDIDYTLKSAGIGVMIAEHIHRRNGHARRGLELLMQQLTREKWTFLRALIHEHNEASRRLFESLNFSAGARKLYRGKPAIQYVCALSEHAI